MIIEDLEKKKECTCPMYIMFKTLLLTALVRRLYYSDFCIVYFYQEPARVD